MQLDLNLFLEIFGLGLTIAGLIKGSNYLIKKIKGGKNQIINQEGKNNSMSTIIIEKQINQNSYPSNKKIAFVSDFPVMAEPSGLFSIYKHHRCTKCGRGYKILPTGSPLSDQIIQCPDPACNNIDKI